MAPISQRSFSGGEIAPMLQGRTDMDRYGTAVKTCRNMVVTRHGSLRKRPGMAFVDQLDAKARRLVPFVYSDDQAYVLAFEEGPGVLSIYAQGAKVARTDPASAAWSSATTYGLGAAVLFGGRTFYSLQGGNVNVTPSSPQSVGWWDTVAPVRLQHPYTLAELRALQWAQSGDVVTLVHPRHRPMELKRFGHGLWTLTAAALPVPRDHSIRVPISIASAEDDYRFPDRFWVWLVSAVVKQANGAWAEQAMSIALQFQGTYKLEVDSRPTKLSWTAPAGLTQDVCYYRIYRGRDGVYGLVGETEATLFYDDGRTPNFADGPKAPLEDDPDLLTGTRKAPGAVAYFEQRLAFAGSDAGPATLWFSGTADFGGFGASHMAAVPIASDALSVRLAALQYERIRAIVPARQLVVLTSAAEWVVGGGGEGLSASTVTARAHSRRGCGELPPLVIGNAILFVGKHGDAVHELAFEQSADGYGDRNLSLLASHLLDGHRIVDWAYQQRPESIVWMVRDDGVLLGMTYDREHGLSAWHRHETAGQVESVCVVPEGGTDTLYLAVRRKLPALQYPQWNMGSGRYPIGTVVRWNGLDNPGPWRLYRSLVWDSDAHEPGVGSTWWELAEDLEQASRVVCLERLAFEAPTDFRLAKHLDCATVLWNGINRTSTRRVRLRTRDMSEPEFFLLDADGHSLAGYLGRGLLLRPSGDDAVLRAVQPVRFAIRQVFSAGLVLVERLAFAGNGPAEPFLDAWTSRWELGAADLVGGLDRFQGVYPGSGDIDAPLVVYSAGLPEEYRFPVGADAPGAISVGSSPVVLAGLPFAAEVELLDAVIPGSNAGFRKKAMRRIGVDIERAAGVPAVGSDLATLEPEEFSTLDGLTGFDLTRQFVDANVQHVFAFEAGGALRQAWCYPLTVLGVVREVEYAGA